MARIEKEDSRTFIESFADSVDWLSDYCYNTARSTAEIAGKIFHPIELNVAMHADNLYVSSRASGKKLNLSKNEGVLKNMLEAQDTELLFATSCELSLIRREKPILTALATIANLLIPDTSIDNEKLKLSLKTKAMECGYISEEGANEDIKQDLQRLNKECKRLIAYEGSSISLDALDSNCKKTAHQIALQYVYRRAFQGFAITATPLLGGLILKCILIRK